MLRFRNTRWFAILLALVTLLAPWRIDLNSQWPIVRAECLADVLAGYIDCYSQISEIDGQPLIVFSNWRDIGGEPFLALLVATADTSIPRSVTDWTVASPSKTISVECDDSYARSIALTKFQSKPCIFVCSWLHFTTVPAKAVEGLILVAPNASEAGTSDSWRCQKITSIGAGVFSGAGVDYNLHATVVGDTPLCIDDYQLKYFTCSNQSTTETWEFSQPQVFPGEVTDCCNSADTADVFTDQGQLITLTKDVNDQIILDLGSGDRCVAGIACSKPQAAVLVREG